jgi:hypothetical protein
MFYLRIVHKCHIDMYDCLPSIAQKGIRIFVTKNSQSGALRIKTFIC